MYFVPLIVSAIAALVITPAFVSALAKAGVVRSNYRGVSIPAASGVVIGVAALMALGPLAAFDELADAGFLHSGLGPVLLYTLGVALLGLVDDLLGGGAPAGAASRPDAPRGWRGHAGAAAHGRLSTGALKAVGALGLALYALSGGGRGWGEHLLSVAVLLLATNLFNLLDLRPGRAIKSLALVGGALTFFWWNVAPLQTLGLLVGPVIVLVPYDLRERAMLGDVGSNALGAMAGFWLVMTLPVEGQLVALVLLVLITVYGEFRSIGALVERNRLLRRLDSIGRLEPARHSQSRAARERADG
ncbi:MAG: hypothetical protein WDZ37_00135 [Solirubrobacterales bacterium]